MQRTTQFPASYSVVQSMVTETEWIMLQLELIDIEQQFVLLKLLQCR